MANPAIGHIGNLGNGGQRSQFAATAPVPATLLGNATGFSVGAVAVFNGVTDFESAGRAIIVASGDAPDGFGADGYGIAIIGSASDPSVRFAAFGDTVVVPLPPGLVAGGAIFLGMAVEVGSVLAGVVGGTLASTAAAGVFSAGTGFVVGAGDTSTGALRKTLGVAGVAVRDSLESGTALGDAAIMQNDIVQACVRANDIADRNVLGFSSFSQEGQQATAYWDHLFSVRRGLRFGATAAQSSWADSIGTVVLSETGGGVRNPDAEAPQPMTLNAPNWARTDEAAYT